MERKQNEGTERIMIKVAWLTDVFAADFFVATTTNKTMEKLIKLYHVL